MRLADILTRTVDYRLRPRYAESDQMGVVYYAHYLVWFECARTEWLRQSGKTYAQLEAEGVFLPVRRCQIDYFEPARYDRLTCIHARVTRLTPVRVEFAYEVFDEEAADSISNIQPSISNIQPSISNVQHPISNIQHPKSEGQTLPSGIQLDGGNAERLAKKSGTRKLAEGMTVHAFVDTSGKIVRRGFDALGVET
ncbi:MAG: thioesterase family protein [Candidatus Sumerlaeota bacterium]|nr:thioesterase family protein [Candidatus Sumerlaeota bacterium]